MQMKRRSLFGLLAFPVLGHAKPTSVLSILKWDWVNLGAALFDGNDLGRGSAPTETFGNLSDGGELGLGQEVETALLPQAYRELEAAGFRQYKVAGQTRFAIYGGAGTPSGCSIEYWFKRTPDSTMAKVVGIRHRLEEGL
jgi:hypothetical protein